MAKHKDKDVKTNAMRILEQKKIPYTVHTYDCEEFMDGISMADALGQPHEIVYKTLVTVAKSGKNYVFVIPAPKELDLKKAAACVMEKSIAMVKSKELLPLTGYIHGGCSPIGMKKFFPTFIDDSAAEFDKIYISAGKVGYQVCLSPADLGRMIKFTFCSLTAED